uniref:Matrix Gla protein n=2 Tax=Xenopus tropicalis TaxID=8364 RepID=A0A803JIN9_XENTR
MLHISLKNASHPPTSRSYTFALSFGFLLAVPTYIPLAFWYLPPQMLGLIINIALLNIIAVSGLYRRSWLSSDSKKSEEAIIEKDIMKTLPVILLLALVAVVALAYDSYESHESLEVYDPFLNSRKANSFMNSQAKNQRMNERIRERNKSPRERQREACEDYDPCERYALRYGFSAAYKRYFGQRRGEKK